MNWYGPILSVRGGHEVRIVEPTSVLCVCNNGVTFFAPSLEVELLEVAGNFGKTVADIIS